MAERQLLERSKVGKLSRCDLYAQEVNLLNEFRSRGFGRMTVIFKDGLPLHAEMAIQSLKFDNPEPTPAK
jgi:hypothetical protein